MNDPRERGDRHSRRGFLQTAGAIGAGVAFAGPLVGAQSTTTLDLTNTGTDQIPRKPFGRTSERLSVIGLGGYSLGSAPSREEAIAIVHEAVDAGVNFFDNAWEYHEGQERGLDGAGAQGSARQGLPDDEGLHARPR